METLTPSLVANLRADIARINFENAKLESDNARLLSERDELLKALHGLHEQFKNNVWGVERLDALNLAAKLINNITNK